MESIDQSAVRVDQSSDQVDQSDLQVDQPALLVNQSTIQVDQSALQVDQSTIQDDQSTTEVDQSTVQVNTMNKEYCLMCKAKFEKRFKGWKRYSLKFAALKPEQFNGENGYICFTCYKKIMDQRDPFRKVRRKKALENKRNSQTEPIFKENMFHYIKTANYGSALATFVKRPAGKQSLEKYLNKSLQEEVKSFPKSSVLGNPPEQKIIENFDWGNVVEEAMSSMPLLVHVLKSALPDVDKWRKGRKFLGLVADSPEDAEAISTQRLGFILSLILYSQCPRAFNLVQGIISYELLERKCPPKIISILSTLGVCLGIKGTKNAVKTVKDRNHGKKKKKQKQRGSDKRQQLHQKQPGSGKQQLQQKQPGSGKQQQLQQKQPGLGKHQEMQQKQPGSDKQLQQKQPGSGKRQQRQQNNPGSGKQLQQKQPGSGKRQQQQQKQPGLGKRQKLQQMQPGSGKQQLQQKQPGSGKQQKLQQKQPGLVGQIDSVEEVARSCVTLLGQMSNSEPSVLERIPSMDEERFGLGNHKSMEAADPESDDSLQKENNEEHDIEESDAEHEQSDEEHEQSDEEHEQSDEDPEESDEDIEESDEDIEESDEDIEESDEDIEESDG